MAYLFTRVKQIDDKIVIESKKMYDALGVLKSHGIDLNVMKFLRLEHYLTFDDNLSTLLHFSNGFFGTIRVCSFEIDESNKVVKIEFPYAIPSQWILVKFTEVTNMREEYGGQSVKLENYTQFIEVNLPEDIENVDEFREYVFEILQLRKVSCPICHGSFFKQDIIVGRAEFCKIDEVYIHKECLSMVKACINILEKLGISSFTRDYLYQLYREGKIPFDVYSSVGEIARTLGYVLY